MRNLIVLAFLFATNLLSAQDIMMQGWYWDYPKTTDGHSWVDTIDQKITEMSEAGINHIWLPPLCRASFGNSSNGYDPKDLYDLGEYGLGATGFGTRAQLDNLVTKANSLGVELVADVVYNHRDGGKAEDNGAVEGWIENHDCTKTNAGENAFPSDRFRCYVPLGGSSMNGAGDYYIKIRSRSKHPNYYDKPYVFYTQTNTVGYQSMPSQDENESSGNGGGDCGQSFISASLGVDVNATIDNVSDCSGWCGIDEYKITLTASDYDSAGDTLWIYLSNVNGQYSDHYIYGLWSASRSLDIQNEVKYQTYTDFSNMPSGQGSMNYLNFKPNGNPTSLSGDWDWLWFFYDYDQFVPDTKTKLIDWTKWLWDDVGIRGLRMDAVKHFTPEFVGDMLDAMDTDGKDPTIVVGEFYDSNPTILANWINSVESYMDASTIANINIRTFDFALRESLKNASDAYGYDARNVFQSGLVDGVSASPFSSVTFLNNHDFRDAGQAIQNEPELGYAYILTNNTIGLPCIFYPDYYGTDLPAIAGRKLKSEIDQLLTIHKNYIYGSTQMDYINKFSTGYDVQYLSGFANTSLIYQSSNGGANGTRDVLSVINYAGEELHAMIQVNTGNNFAVGDTLYDLTGKSKSPITLIDGNSKVEVIIPARSYAVFSNSMDGLACVGSNKIYVDLNATGLNDGSDWENAFTHLQSAIVLAQVCTNIEEIHIKEGTYYANSLGNRDLGFSLNKNLKIYGSYPASISNPVLTDREIDATPTILSGDIGTLGDDTDNVYHVINASSMAGAVLLDQLVIKGGHADGSYVTDQHGAGIYNTGLLNLNRVYFDENSATMTSDIYNIGAASVINASDIKVINSNTSGTQVHCESGTVNWDGLNVIDN
ncbi:MAG: hypothetical protein H6572_10660 [Lewinellaceae bacterium]|nr:hypothetical protein [Lewinellaceae bacterium]